MTDGDRSDRKGRGEAYTGFRFAGPVAVSIGDPKENPTEWRPVGTALGVAVSAARPVDRDVLADAGPEQLRAATGMGRLSSICVSVSVDTSRLTAAIKLANDAVDNFARVVAEGQNKFGEYFRVDFPRVKLVEVPKLTPADKYWQRRAYKAWLRSCGNIPRKRRNGFLERRTARDRGYR